MHPKQKVSLRNGIGRSRVYTAVRNGLLLLVVTGLGAYGQLTPLPLQQETAVAEQMASHIRTQDKLVSDPAIHEYLYRLASRLAGPAVHLRIDLVEADEGITHEPIWLPAGYMFVSGSLILAARDESEFASMLAHAIAHEIARDWQRVREQTPAGQIPLILPGSELLGKALPHSVRPFELQADASAVAMLARAGYDPAGLLHYLERNQAADTERIAAVDRAIAAEPVASQVLIDSSDFRQVQERLAPPRRIGRPTLFH